MTFDTIRTHLDSLAMFDEYELHHIMQTLGAARLECVVEVCQLLDFGLTETDEQEILTA